MTDYGSDYSEEEDKEAEEVEKTENSPVKGNEGEVLNKEGEVFQYKQQQDGGLNLSCDIPGYDEVDMFESTTEVENIEHSRYAQYFQLLY